LLRGLQHLAGRANLVPRTKVVALDAAHQRLLDATAKEAWAQGVRDAAHVLHAALARERERVASEAPRGLLHMHPGEGDRDTTGNAADAVVDTLLQLGITDVLGWERSSFPPYAPERLLVSRPVSDDLRAQMVRTARWFMLRYGQHLEEDEAYRRLDEHTGIPE
jgi:hypothetical protein